MTDTHTSPVTALAWRLAAEIELYERRPYRTPLDRLLLTLNENEAPLLLELLRSSRPAQLPASPGSAAVSHFPDEETELAFLEYLNAAWPLWRQNVGNIRWHDMRKAFIAGRGRPAQLPASPVTDEARRQYAEDWKRQIINAGGDENIAQQAVALAALNGLFDHSINAQGRPSIELVKARLAALCERNAALYELDDPNQVTISRNGDEIGFLQSLLRSEGEDTSLPPTGLAALPSAPSAPEGAWQPIETAPKDRNVYLSDGDETKFPWVDYWDAEYGWWRIARELGAKPEPKFWMEIPAFTSTPSAPEGAWQPIDTAPKDGTVIFVTVHTDFYGWVRGTAHWESHGGISGWIARGISEPPGVLGLANPTLWQPLPGAPVTSTEPPFDPAEWEKTVEDRQEQAAGGSTDGGGK